MAALLDRRMTAKACKRNLWWKCRRTGDISGSYLVNGMAYRNNALYLYEFIYTYINGLDGLCVIMRKYRLFIHINSVR